MKHHVNFFKFNTSDSINFSKKNCEYKRTENLSNKIP